MSSHFVHLVIRSAGERTSDCCRRIAESQLPAGASLSVVNEVPFEKALRRSYEIGIESGCKWLMTLDADVLLAPGAIGLLLNEADRMPKSYFQLEAQVFDKVLGKYREVGHRVYRTSLLHKAIKLVPESGERIRPEFHTVWQMGQRGHSSRILPGAIGIHDFEQYYGDLYRKAFIHARKHRSFAGDILKRCGLAYLDDPDYRVIMKGFWDGLVDSESIGIDVDLFREKGRIALAEMGMKEKHPLVMVENPIENMSVEGYYEFALPFAVVVDRPRGRLFGFEVRLENFGRRVRFYGLLKTVRLTLGGLCFKMAELLHR